MANDKWHFIHGLVKSMVMNSLSYASLLFRDEKSPLVRKIEDIKSHDLQLRYAAMVRAFDINKKNMPNVRLFGAINILFSVCDEDHIYETFIVKYDEELDKLKQKDISGLRHDIKVAKEQYEREKEDTNIKNEFKEQNKENFKMCQDKLRTVLLGEIKEYELNVR